MRIDEIKIQVQSFDGDAVVGVQDLDEMTFTIYTATNVSLDLVRMAAGVYKVRDSNLPDEAILKAIRKSGEWQMVKSTPRSGNAFVQVWKKGKGKDSAFDQYLRDNGATPLKDLGIGAK